MGKAGLETCFPCFKEFPPRYVPGTESSGRPAEISLGGQLDSNCIFNIHENELYFS